MMANLRLFSVNVRGLRDKAKRRKIFQWCKMSGDIVLMQETFSTEDIEHTWRDEWEGTIHFSHGSNHSKGVIIMFKPNIAFDIENILTDKEGRYVIIKGKWKSKKIILVNVYFPTSNKENAQCEMLIDLDKLISSLLSEEYSIIIGGDCNVVMNRDLDYMGSSSLLKKKFRDLLQDFLDNQDLIDVWRTLHPNKKEYTFKQKTPFVQSRLDYIFISSKLKKIVKDSEIVPSITPDHAGVRVEFLNDSDSFSFGKSYWKFNSSLCSDKDFQDGVRIKISEIEETWRDQISSKVKFWEFMKMKLREYIMKFSRERAKLRKLQVEKLEKELKDLNDQLVINFQKKIQDQIDLKKVELEKMFDYSRQGLKVRSRAEWSEEGERNSQFFEQLLKSNKRKSIIKKIYDDNGLVECDERIILKIIRKFYGNLYDCRHSEINVDVDHMFLNDLPKLSQENKKFL